MSFKTDTIRLDELAADPGSPVDGELWYNTTSDRVKIRQGGASRDLSHKSELDAHEADVANPHTTTLELARTAGNTLAGDIAMGGNKITGLGAGSSSGDAATIQNVDDKIQARLQGFSWQDPIIDDDLVTSPGSPSAGDRYIIAGIGGAWSGFTIDDIAEFDGSVWFSETPVEGFATRILDEDRFKVFNGASWEFFALSVDHALLLNLTAGDPHTQYLLRSGASAMTGALDMGANAIINVGLVDGVDVSDHDARHILAGADEIDGDQLGIDFTPSSYTPSTAPAEATSVDHLTAHLSGIDTALSAATGPVTKAGSELSAGFAGNPKKITVTFSTAFASAAYAVTVTAVTTSNTTFSAVVEGQAAASFDINMGANNIANLTQVNWIAIEDNDP